MKRFKDLILSFFVQPHLSRILRFISFLLIFWAALLSLETQAHAQTLNINPCQIFIQKQKQPNNFEVNHVEILGDNGRGVVGVMILGLPKHVFATVNGIDVSNLKTDSTAVICSGQRVGELSSYDLRPLNIDAGYFQIKAGRFSDGRNVSM